MNKSNILKVLLVVGLMVVTGVVVYLCSKGDSPESAVLQNIMTRTSIRSYQDREVEDYKVEKLLRAAMAAPTARNKQPWKFIVIKDKQTLKAISDHFSTMRMAQHAPMAIVVCGDMEQALSGDARAYWAQDASAATENLLLAAHAMGLGAVWCGIYPIQERVATLKELLKLPTNITPLNVIPIGYPNENPTPKDKWKPENVHYELWGQVNS